MKRTEVRSGLQVSHSKPWILVMTLVSQVIVENYVALQVRLKAYVLDTKYEKALVNDITLRTLEAFAKQGIHPPAILHRRVEDLELSSDPGLRIAEGKS